jgi:hypothetical protein
LEKSQFLLPIVVGSPMKFQARTSSPSSFWTSMRTESASVHAS